jgi:RNA polymerase sigma-70 factor (ECF subfamily)
MNGGDRTRASLILRLKQAPQDQGAWSEFVDRYEPLLLDWCRRWRLQEADARDVAQTVMVHLTTKIGQFEYDPGRSFRAWLRTLAHHVCHDLVLRKRQPQTNLPATGNAVLDLVEARADLQARLEAAFDLELLAQAAAEVRARVQPKTWEAYHLTAEEGLSGAEAAGRLGMQVLAVFKAKSNVQRLLQEAVRRLEEGPP